MLTSLALCAALTGFQNDPPLTPVPMLTVVPSVSELRYRRHRDFVHHHPSAKIAEWIEKTERWLKNPSPDARPFEIDFMQGELATHRAQLLIMKRFERELAALETRRLNPGRESAAAVLDRMDELYRAWMGAGDSSPFVPWERDPLAGVPKWWD